MKIFEQFGDLISMCIGMAGALLKGLKTKMHPFSVFLSMIIAGIFSYSTIGLIEMFYADLSQKVIILIAFCVGWIANEITSKLDLFVNDMYQILLDWVKSKFKVKKDENK